MLRLLLVLAILVVCSASLMGQGHCSLVLTVVTPSGEEVPEAIVTLEESSGRTISSNYRRGGIRFCDLGIHPVTVQVGSEACNGVTVHNIPLVYGSTVNVKVTYDREPCLRNDITPLACQILLRFMDREERWLPDVRLDPAPDTYPPTPPSDPYGRLQVWVFPGEEWAARAEKEGFVPQELKETCKPAEGYFEERLVVMEAMAANR